MFKNCEIDSSQIIEMFSALNRTFRQVFLSTTGIRALLKVYKRIRLDLFPY